MKYGGLTSEDALKLVTINPAKQLRLDHRMGSIEAGKDADVVIWTGHPLSTYSRVETTFVDGEPVFDRTTDLANRAALALRGAIAQRGRSATSSSRVSFRAVDSGTTIELDARDPAVVIGDPVRLQQVAMNLVLNALDAVAGGARKVVRVSVECVEGMAELRVADSGPGIPPEAAEKLFLPYFSTKRRGTGLGLAIVSRIISEHEGTIRAEENRPTGALFVIELPVERTGV